VASVLPGMVASSQRPHAPRSRLVEV
jgi:hypothetical protein